MLNVTQNTFLTATSLDVFLKMNVRACSESQREVCAYRSALRQSTTSKKETNLFALETHADT